MRVFVYAVFIPEDVPCAADGPGSAESTAPTGLWGTTEGAARARGVFAQASSPVIRLRSHIVPPGASHPTDEKKG